LEINTNNPSIPPVTAGPSPFETVLGASIAAVDAVTKSSQEESGKAIIPKE